MTLKRQVMKFLIPVSVESLQRNDLTGREVVPVYINPKDFSIKDTKLVSKKTTKGGFIIEYWGEDLSMLQVSGTTGSGGIEAVEILRSIYRNEQIQFKNLILQRAREFAEQAQESMQNTDAANVQAGIVEVLDSISNDGFSGIIDGTKSIIEQITNAFEGVTRTPERIQLIPTLGAYALSVDLYFQGEKFRGFFNDFSVSENADTPGLFNYSFTFTILKRSGKRKNFMPWHRRPRTSDGNLVSASMPLEGQKLDELSFPSSSTQLDVSGLRLTSSIFTNTAENPSPDINDVGINRFDRLKR